MRAYSELPCCSGVVLALPMSLCSSHRETTRYQSELSSQALHWVGSGVQGGNGDISFSLWSALFFQYSHTWLPLTGLQPHLDATSQPSPALGDVIGNGLSHNECLIWPASSTSVCHRSLTQVKQCSCGHYLWLEQSSTSSGSGKPSQALNTAQLGTWWHSIIMWQKFS